MSLATNIGYSFFHPFIKLIGIFPLLWVWKVPEYGQGQKELPLAIMCQAFQEAQIQGGAKVVL